MKELAEAVLADGGGLWRCRWDIDPETEEHAPGGCEAPAVDRVEGPHDMDCGVYCAEHAPRVVAERCDVPHRFHVRAIPGARGAVLGIELAKAVLASLHDAPTPDSPPNSPAGPSAMRRGGWMQTYTGRAFWPLDPDPTEVSLEDIAHALACQNRYAGHAREPYSVAEHSYRVMRYVTENGERLGLVPESQEHVRAQLAALLHDAPESYLVDLPRPVKHSPEMAAYRDAEARLATVLEAWAGLPRGAFEWPCVKIADEVLLATEARDLLVAPPMPWSLREPPLQKPITQVMTWQAARREFRHNAARLMALVSGNGEVT